jgi:hypothetical protein
MGLLPASHRARRRLVWVAALAGLLVAGVGIVALIPSHGPPAGAPLGSEGKAQLAVASSRVSAAERRAIDRVLDRFIPASLGRKDADLAWSLAGPELRSSSSLKKWRAGSTPVPAYPVRGTTFHDWTTIDAGPAYVIFNILIHPTSGAKVAPYEFSGEMVKEHGRWLVNRLYTIAIFNRVTKTTHEIGPADFAAPPASPTPRGKARLGAFGLIPLFGLLALGLLVPLGFAGAALVRARRWKRQVQVSARTELPPLPSTFAKPKKTPVEH